MTWKRRPRKGKEIGKLEGIKVERIKMSRQERAKQFAPFDALKGLHNALRLKEYEHERVQKGDLTEEKAEAISKILLGLEKGDSVKAVYFEDGHNKEISGKAKLIIEEHILQVEKKKILLDDLLNIEII